jgi:hypothetical protein
MICKFSDVLERDSELILADESKQGMAALDAVKACGNREMPWI